MSILFNSAKVSFNELTYLRPDPFDVNNQIFEYPSNVNMLDYRFLYYYINNVLSTISVANTEIMPGQGRRIKLKLGSSFTSHYCYPGMKLKLLCVDSQSAGIDFIDKYGQAGTVYAYDTFNMQNESLFNKLTNITITSENLQMGFLNDYPCRFRHVKYTNGAPSVSVNLSYNGVNTSKLIAYFNSIYKGAVSNGGYISNFTSAKPGALDIIYRGDLEFAFSFAGPWSTVLTVPDMLPQTQLTIYVRSGQIITAPIKLLNSVRIFATEVV